MIEPDAQVIARLTPFGPIATWTGGTRATIDRETVMKATGDRRVTAGTLFEFGRLKLRVVSYPFFTYAGAGYSDQALVMLESPHAQLFWLYREKAEGLIRLIANLETRLVAAYRGLTLRRSPEGELLRFTSVLADRLL